MTKMFKKRKNVNLRKRGDSSEDEDAKKEDKIPFIDDSMDVDTPLPTATSLGKMKKRNEHKIAGEGIASRTSSSNLLSFEDEEEEETFQIKKPQHNKKHVKKFKEKRKEDKDKGKPNENMTFKPPEARVNTAVKSSQWKKGSEVSNGKATTHTGVNEGDDNDDDFKPPFSNLPPGVIPDAAMIHAARKRRQLARELGDSYIPIDDTQRFENSSSRLVRDDDNDRSDNEEEGDDDDERISFTVVPELSQRQRVMQAIGEVDSDESEKEHDEELQRWEQEQIKKGTSVPQIQNSSEEQPSSSSSYIFASYDYGQPQGMYSNTTGLPKPLMSINPFTVASNTTDSPTQNLSVIMPPKELPSVTLDQVKKQLKDRFDGLDQVHRAHQREMDQVQDNLSSSEESTVRLKSSFGDLELQYKFFQEMRGYVRDLVECLNAKVPVINSLETQIHNGLKQRSSKLVQRRQEDIKDQSEDFTMKGTKAASAPNLDAHGRDRNSRESNAKQRRQAEREARRARRRRARQFQGTDQGHYEGISSDDEVPDSEIASFQAEKERLLECSRTLFEDVVDEFSTFNGIKPHFEKWKYAFSETYTEAYIALCLPKLFSPFVRLQLLSWNPLEANCPDFEHMEWFESLMFYGFREGEGIEKEDPDVKLMPSLLEKVVLPKLTYLVEHVWDPMSSTQTQRLVNFVHRIAEEYPTVSADNKYTQNLLKAIVGRMRKTLDDDVYVPLFPKILLENKASGANTFLQRQFWSCVKLLGDILLWNGIVSSSVLQELALDGLLNRYLLLSLQNSDVNEESITKCQRIVSTFPRQWFANLEGDSTLRQLENLCRYLQHTVSTVHLNAAGGSDIDKRRTKETMKTVIKLLVNVHAMDHALSIASEYSLKDMQSMFAKI
ncbi:PAX3- and PAX7-binding protein 1-like [Glandiceps talaboti]